MEKTTKPASASQQNSTITKPAPAHSLEQKKVTTYASVTSKSKASVTNVLAATSSTNNKQMQKHAMPTTPSDSQPNNPIPKSALVNIDEQMKVTSYASVTGKPKATEGNVFGTTPATDKMVKTAKPTTAGQQNAPITTPASAYSLEQKKVTSYASVTSKPNARVSNLLAATSSTNNKDMMKHVMPTTASVGQPEALTTKPLEAKPTPASSEKQKKVTTYASVASKPKASVINVLAATSSTNNKQMPTTTSASQPKAPTTKSLEAKPTPASSEKQKKVTLMPLLLASGKPE
ncbi:hypothetical protein BSL78_14251 [Apostichopus japonicus]|uniref:Uncharacterized protein n=1 Tax=Stichopus japonicus TaxID=307972 RepID=A0A2G8KLP5_STIJA|nr:hypothetical protein BSL78_14251 [Apostichopus japonicus]